MGSDHNFKEKSHKGADTLQEKILRKYGNSDGEVQVVRPVNLAEFLDLPQSQRAMHAHLNFVG